MSSDEEKKIWGELERDVERELEEEIKDGICKLALRLHRLYSDRKERNNNNNGANSDDSKTLSEVSINIRMEGGTKIEIKEIKKEARRSSTRRGAITVAPPPPPPPRGQKFDWPNTLRSGPSHHPTGYNKQIEKSNATTASIQRKKKKNLGLINALELGWKP
ncbi:PREDICTED: uncharacterized protein LOC109180280 [Ipomoea nil]|uniref:uncharacterized protein LOC109180280 n=1 Tax=Ipomoea nil TaxID=35883 RepID=UPI000900E170|nr:PREDICTED: uncharacterized protein LOC109180280 [Ipomoea nil]